MTKIWTRIAEAAFITIWLGMVAEGLWEIRVLPDPHRVHPGRGRHPPPHRRDPRGVVWASFRVGRFLIGRRLRALREDPGDLQEPR